MSSETEYFHGLTVCDWHRAFYCLRVGALLTILIWLLAGCASQPAKTEEGIVTKVCYMKALGQTEDGFTVVMEACQSPEAFKASQAGQ